MNPSEITLGMKVVPIKKSVMGNLDSSIVWRNAMGKKQPYLYVVGFSNNKEHRLNKNGKVKKEEVLEYALNDVKQYGGDFFLASDFKPYKE